MGNQGDKYKNILLPGTLSLVSLAKNGRVRMKYIIPNLFALFFSHILYLVKTQHMSWVEITIDVSCLRQRVIDVKIIVAQAYFLLTLEN